MTDLQQVQDSRFRSAKRWFGGSLIGKVVALSASLTSLHPEWAQATPYVVVALSVMSELAAWRSEIVKGSAERALRLFERFDGIGVRIEREDWADLGIAVTSISTATIPYFSADEAKGPRRVLENVRESAWWTRHLATTMVKWLIGTIVAAVVVSTVLLITAVAAGAEQSIGVVAARSATIVLAAVVSLGLVKLAYSYHLLARRAEVVGMQARDRLSREPSELAALGILHDYQIVRTNAPVIPEFVYRTRRQYLLRAWADAKVQG